jgi:hypothetical protein
MTAFGTTRPSRDVCLVSAKRPKTDIDEPYPVTVPSRGFEGAFGRNELRAKNISANILAGNVNFVRGEFEQCLGV